jgi:hypothetical protein
LTLATVGNVKREMQAMAEAAKQNPRANLENVFSDFSLKRRNYYGAMGGKERGVVDTHMGDVMYPEGVFRRASGQQGADLYNLGNDVMGILARYNGVPIQQFQGSVWIPWRRAQGMMDGNDPMAQILQRVGEKSEPYQFMLKNGYLKGASPQTLRTLAVTLPLSALYFSNDQPAAAPPEAAAGARR